MENQNIMQTAPAETFLQSILHDIKHMFKPKTLYRNINPNAQLHITVKKFFFYYGVMAVFTLLPNILSEHLKTGKDIGPFLIGFPVGIVLGIAFVALFIFIFCLLTKLFTAIFGGERDLKKIAQGMAAYSVTIIITAVLSLLGNNVITYAPVILATALYTAYFQYAFLTVHLKSNKIASGILVSALLLISVGFSAYNKKIVAQQQAIKNETAGNQLTDKQKETLKNMFSAPKEQVKE